MLWRRGARRGCTKIVAGLKFEQALLRRSGDGATFAWIMNL